MVQTFIVEESKELIYDSDKIQEWKNKCEELGLSNQLLLAEKDKSPVPFECMNEVQKRVYETLCPAKENYKQYKRTAIPLEVLSLIALAEKEGYFNEIQIWYDNKTPDPIAVGLIKETDWRYLYYSIAKWGDELRPFEELKEKAMQVYRNTSFLTLSHKVNDAKNNIENLDINVARYFDVQAEHYDIIGF
jgi:hypothetical protein